MHNNVSTAFFNSGITLSFFCSCKELFNLLNWSLPQPAAESSSLPSGQSLSPSQSQRLGTQAYDPGQLNSPGAQVTDPERKTGPHALLSKAEEYTGSNAPQRRMNKGNTKMKQIYLVKEEKRAGCEHGGKPLCSPRGSACRTSMSSGRLCIREGLEHQLATSKCTLRVSIRRSGTQQNVGMSPYARKKNRTVLL